MAEQGLDGADVVAGLEQVGGKAMAQVCIVTGVWNPAAARAVRQAAWSTLGSRWRSSLWPGIGQ